MTIDCAHCDAPLVEVQDYATTRWMEWHHVEPVDDTYPEWCGLHDDELEMLCAEPYDDS